MGGLVRKPMHILLYIPDNQIVDNFVPQLWPFVLKQLTPMEHRVTIIDGNSQKYDPHKLAQFILDEHVDLVGMGFMTRMAQQAYETATVIRQRTSIPIVMGGPHVTELPDEPLGFNGHPQYADSVVLGEAEDIWPVVIADAVQGKLQKIYKPKNDGKKDAKPSLANYPIVQWEKMDLSFFNLMRFIPVIFKKLLKRLGVNFEKVYVIPVESGRGCPYGCEFCTVTSFFGEEIRFRTNENVLAELKYLKAIAKKDKALLIVFFVDDNFAINPHRTKSLLREMVSQDACIPWVGQISINLLRDEELVQLIAASDCRWLFIGLESMDHVNLKAAHKEFNKPHEYEAILHNLARHNLYAITSFIYGMDEDKPGVWKKTAMEIDKWPPGLPVFGLLTPYPGTPLYTRLLDEGRLTRPKHWLNFQTHKSTFIPKAITPEEVEAEIQQSWDHCYSPASFRRTQKWLVANDKDFGPQLMHFFVRLVFRGIYFQQRDRWQWIKLLARNFPTILSLIYSGTLAQINKKK